MGIPIDVFWELNPKYMYMYQDKNAKYPQKPYSLVEKEKPLSPEEKFKLWIEEFNKKFDENQGTDVS